MHISPKARAGEVLFCQEKLHFLYERMIDFSFEKKRVVENGKGKRQGREGEMERDKKKSKF
tara:strand:+ start:153 stop:335 length:183 start_codon:yes stop_codon:yes gene_type:complete